jgi:acyl-CoA dehydrogenase
VPINVTPIPGLSPENNDIRRRTGRPLYESRRGFEGEEQRDDRRESAELRDEIKAKVVRAGLWAPHLPKEYAGAGLDFLTLAYMYEILHTSWGQPRSLRLPHPTPATPAFS